MVTAITVMTITICKNTQLYPNRQAFCPISPIARYFYKNK